MRIERIDPGVVSIINPIIATMQDFAYKRQFNPMIGHYQEPIQEKIAKRACVHIRCTNGQDYEYAVEKRLVDSDDTPGTKEERYVCKLCDRKLYHHYNDSAIKILNKALEVINGYILMIPAHNVSPNVLQMFISLKNTWPEVMKICQETNQLISLQEQDGKIDKNMVADYNTGGILGMNSIYNM